MLTINTNIAAIRVANQLTRNQAEVNLALERLSTGQRINSAKDDAAGLAIATRFTAQINGQEVARRNAGDGISLAQTAEGGLETITSNLQRVRELAVQAANATNNAEDRAALDDEVQQRLEEVDRIARQTGSSNCRWAAGTRSPPPSKPVRTAMPSPLLSTQRTKLEASLRGRRRAVSGCWRMPP